MARFNRPYVDVGPISTNHHVSTPVLSAGHLLTVCRIVRLASLVNGRGSSSATEMEESSVHRVGCGR